MTPGDSLISVALPAWAPSDISLYGLGVTLPGHSFQVRYLCHLPAADQARAPCPLGLHFSPRPGGIFCLAQSTHWGLPLLPAGLSWSLFLQRYTVTQQMTLLLGLGAGVLGRLGEDPLRKGQAGLESRARVRSRLAAQRGGPQHRK